MSDARWYDRHTGEIINEVMKADGKGTTKPTLVHAKKFGHLGSVTTIIKDTTATGQNLIDWIIGQHLDACMGNPFAGDIANKVVVDQYKGMIKAKANEFRNFTADRGKYLHNEVELWIKSGCKETALSSDPAGKTMCLELDRFFQENNVQSINPEMALFSIELGCAGTPDIPCICKDGTKILIDLKTTSFKNYRKPYDSWKYQLGGYRALSKDMEGARLVQAIGDRDHGDVIYEMYEEADGSWSAGFLRLVDNWCLIKGYDPRRFDE